jgi:hypothetical protein
VTEEHAMTVTIEELFAEAKIDITGKVDWGTPIRDSAPGVYVISLADPSMFRIDLLPVGERAYWVPDESIIYIGRAARLSVRLDQFYRHRRGERSPHSGGQNILWLEQAKLVHWASFSDYADAEHRLISIFQAKTAGHMPFGNRVRSARQSRSTVWRAVE